VTQDPKIVSIASRRRHVGDPGAAGPRAFDEVLGANLDALYATARILCGDAVAAEDLVQVTALRAFKAWGELRSLDAARSWLFQILRRAFINQRRDAARRPTIVDVDLDSLLDHPILESAPEPAIGNALSEDVGAALDALALPFREVVWLVDVEELTLAEAAAVLEVPVGTVASRIHRARRHRRPPWMTPAARIDGRSSSTRIPVHTLPRARRAARSATWSDRRPRWCAPARRACTRPPCCASGSRWRSIPRSAGGPAAAGSSSPHWPSPPSLW
jgi:RNA polymerase sigma-70 factor (ECF subfamily)